MNKLYRIENEETICLLTFYKYKDNGGDCNNLFWSMEDLKIQNNKLVFTTHYFQKTGLDPIPEWRKQIYLISEKGKLSLIYDKYKYYNSLKWVDKQL